MGRLWKLNQMRLALLSCVLLCLLGCAPEVEVQGTYSGPEKPDPPRVSVNSVGRLSLKGPGKLDVFGGTCFLAERSSGNAIVGAYHVMQYAKSETVVTLVSKVPELASGSPEQLPLSGQESASYNNPATTCDAAGDLAGFRVLSSHEKSKALPLAATPPKVGEPLWVVQLAGGARTPTGVSLVRGVVAKHSNRLLLLKMDGRSNVKWTSGAPVVNQKGEVVGVNVGFAEDANGYHRVAAPTESLKALLR